MENSTCDMYVRNIDWPKPCRDLIGIRLQVINIPIVRYVKSGISEVKTVEKDTKEQEKINKIQGLNNTYYAGAHLGYGFHEDGLTSALKVSNIIDNE